MEKKKLTDIKLKNFHKNSVINQVKNENINKGKSNSSLNSLKIN
jgi:hypothetical protein